MPRVNTCQHPRQDGREGRVNNHLLRQMMRVGDPGGCCAGGAFFGLDVFFALELELEGGGGIGDGGPLASLAPSDEVDCFFFFAMAPSFPLF